MGELVMNKINPTENDIKIRAMTAEQRKWHTEDKEIETPNEYVPGRKYDVDAYLMVLWVLDEERRKIQEREETICKWKREVLKRDGEILAIKKTVNEWALDFLDETSGRYCELKRILNK
jgi:hypothetical protein